MRILLSNHINCHEKKDFFSIRQESQLNLIEVMDI